MQFYQPNFQPPGFSPCGQSFGFQAPIPPQPNFTGYPDLIGEGNVITFTSPDGSTQLVFLPTVQWPQCRTFQVPVPQYNQYFGHTQANVLCTGAWLVRNIFNQIQPMFCHPFQDCHGLQYVRPADSCVNLQSPPVCMSQSAFLLKFHNDNCTSTSDLKYFIPKQCTWFRTANDSVGVQVEVPTVANAACNYEIIQEAKQCKCTPTNKSTAEEIECKCKSNNSCMSIDSSDSKHKRHKEKSHKSKKKSRSNSSDMSIDSTKSSHKCKAKSRKQKRVKSKRSRHTCECKEPQADKSVVTYTDQGNYYCAPDTGRETQTFGNPTSFTACNCDPTLNKKSKPKTGCSKKVCKSLSWDSVVSNRRRNRSDLESCTCTSRSDLSDY